MSSVLSHLFQSQKNFQQSNHTYRGRFAPSPSGPLHLGSLVAALGSFLQARKNQGLWFVRIEDIDETRAQRGAQQQILEALEAFGMDWDIDSQTKDELEQVDQGCLVQSKRKERYESILSGLKSCDLIYSCQCTRKQIKAMGGLYDGRCQALNLPKDDLPIRLSNRTPILSFTDRVFGHQKCDPKFAGEDFIIKRRDGLFAYQLVVVIDDIDQGITEVVRGADIMELTTRQLSLYQLFGVEPPKFLHLPLISKEQGFKLSKQNHATAIDVNNPKPELIQALNLLGLPTFEELSDLSVAEIINWAVEHWSLEGLPKQQEIVV